MFKRLSRGRQEPSMEPQKWHDRYEVAFRVAADGPEVARMLRGRISDIGLPRNAIATVSCLTDAVRKDSVIIARLQMNGKSSVGANSNIRDMFASAVYGFIEDDH